MQIDLTIGSAMFGEVDQVLMTYQALRMMHPEVMKRTELILVNNQRDAHKAARIKGLFEGWFKGTVANSRYIEYFDTVGTSQSREQIFTHAQGKVVMVIDPHIFIKLGGVQAVLDYFERNPESKDIISGPLLWDNLVTGTTHFSNVWRAEMWGVWGIAWETSEESGSYKFTVYEDQATHTCVFISLEMDHSIITGTTVGNKFTFPVNLPWVGHERVILGMGARVIDQPGREIEIPGMGLGMFAMRKEAWPHFNPHQRHFGGEELYIHEKVRANGGRAIMLTDAAWWHKFRDEEDKIPYPNSFWDKTRNYVIELQELGKSIDPVYNEFVLTGRITQRKWNYLLEDPIGREREPTADQLGVPETASECYDEVLPIKRDLNEHLPLMKELADKCKHVTEFSKRRESLIALAASKADFVMSFNTEMNDNLARICITDRGNRMSAYNTTSGDVAEIPETDFLFIDSTHKYDSLKEELEKYAPKVRRFIAFHDTVSYGINGEDGGPGLVPAIRNFIELNPWWFFYKHSNAQHGFTVLSRNEEDRPEKPFDPLPPTRGPGTKLKKINAQLGIVPTAACDCNRFAFQMDQWGVQGCRNNRDEIIKFIAANSEKWGWADKAKAALLAIKTGIAMEIPDWTNPYPGLVDLAIRQAAEEEADIERKRKARLAEAPQA